MGTIVGGRSRADPGEDGRITIWDWREGERTITTGDRALSDDGDVERGRVPVRTRRGGEWGGVLSTSESDCERLGLRLRCVEGT